jgi:hypothetical protein
MMTTPDPRRDALRGHFAPRLLISLAEASSVLGFSRQYGHKLLRAGRWPTPVTSVAGGYTRIRGIRVEDLADYLYGPTVAPAPAPRRRGRPTRAETAARVSAAQK